MDDRREYRRERDQPLELVVIGLAAVFLTWAATLDGYDVRDLRVDPPLSHLLAGALAAMIWVRLLIEIRSRRSGDGREPDLVLDAAGLLHLGRSTGWDKVLTIEVARRFGSRRVPSKHVVVWCKDVPNVVIDPSAIGADAEELRAEIDRRERAARRAASESRGETPNR